MQRLDRRLHLRAVAAPIDGRVVNKKLKFIAVWVAQIQASADGVIGHTVDGLPAAYNRVYAVTRGSRRFSGLCDTGRCGVLRTARARADFDEQQLVVCAAAA